jgi:hypothetical protein
MIERAADHHQQFVHFERLLKEIERPSFIASMALSMVAWPSS